MKHKPNHIIHFAIGVKRVNKCIDNCRQPMTITGSLYTDRFNTAILSRILKRL